LKAAYDSALSHDDGYMRFVLAIELWLDMRPDGATRGKWRMLDGKGESDLFFMFGASKVVAPACVD
jgi:hypothetical protein